MENLVAGVNTVLSRMADNARVKDAILFFAVDFAATHPFVDSNGRVACILADLLAIRASLPAFHFTDIKSRDKAALTRAVEYARDQRDLALLNGILNTQGRPEEGMA